LYLWELRDELFVDTGADVSISMVYRELESVGFSWKRVTKVARERDEEPEREHVWLTDDRVKAKQAVVMAELHTNDHGL
jgi:transposase